MVGGCAAVRMVGGGSLDEGLVVGVCTVVRMAGGSLDEGLVVGGHAAVRMTRMRLTISGCEHNEDGDEVENCLQSSDGHSHP